MGSLPAVVREPRRHHQPSNFDIYQSDKAKAVREERSRITGVIVTVNTYRSWK